MKLTSKIGVNKSNAHEKKTHKLNTDIQHTASSKNNTDQITTREKKRKQTNTSALNRLIIITAVTHVQFIH